MKKIFIGIDVSKETLDATAIFQGNLGEKAYTRVGNNGSGHRELLKWAKGLAKQAGMKLSREEALFCCENTGAYGTTLCEFLSERHMEIWEEHPTKISRSLPLKRGKTDKADSAAIAEYAMRYQDKAVPYKPMTESQKKLRALLNYRADLVKQRTMATNQLKSRSVLKGSKHNPGLIRRDCEARIKSLTASIRAVEKEAEALIAADKDLAQVYEILVSFKGVGPINAITIMVRTSNFEKFDMNARKLAAYYGVAPYPNESGTSVKGQSRVSQCADKSIKALLSQAALSAARHNKPLRDYYQRLTAAGKKEGVVLNNIKNKILHILVAMVRNKTKFDPNYIERYYA